MTNALADADRMMPRRALRGDARGPLAQFQLAADDDPSETAKTLERGPVTRSVAAKLVAPPPAKTLNANRTEEVRVEDVLEAIPLVAHPPPESTRPTAAVPVPPTRPSPRAIVVPPPAARVATPARPRAGSTQEVDLADVLEVVQIDHHPASVFPLTTDVGVHRRFVELTLDNYRLPVRKSVVLVMGGVVACALALLVVAVTATRPGGTTVAATERTLPAAAKPVSFARASSPVATSAPAPATTVANGGVPEVSVLSLPRVPPTTGTLRLEDSAIGHRLFVDGEPQSGSSAEVRCGRHVVKVGSAGHPHVVVVGCGEEVAIGH